MHTLQCEHWGTLHDLCQIGRVQCRGHSLCRRAQQRQQSLSLMSYATIRQRGSKLAFPIQSWSLLKSAQMLETVTDMLALRIFRNRLVYHCCEAATHDSAACVGSALTVEYPADERCKGCVATQERPTRPPGFPGAACTHSAEQFQNHCCASCHIWMISSGSLFVHSMIHVHVRRLNAGTGQRLTSPLRHNAQSPHIRCVQASPPFVQVSLPFVHCE